MGHGNAKPKEARVTFDTKIFSGGRFALDSTPLQCCSSSQLIPEGWKNVTWTCPPHVQSASICAQFMTRTRCVTVLRVQPFALWCSRCGCGLQLQLCKTVRANISPGCVCFGLTRSWGLLRLFFVRVPSEYKYTIWNELEELANKWCSISIVNLRLRNGWSGRLVLKKWKMPNIFTGQNYLTPKVTSTDPKTLSPYHDLIQQVWG